MFAIPLAVVFLDERLTLRALAGIALTLAGIVLLQLWKHPKSRATESSGPAAAVLQTRRASVA